MQPAKQRSRSIIYRFSQNWAGKESPSFLTWYFATGAVSVVLAALCLILWTIISPLNMGTDVMNEIQGETGDTIFSTTASVGTLILIIFYFLDFYSAPHLHHKGSKFLTEMEALRLQDEAEDRKHAKEMANASKTEKKKGMLTSLHRQLFRSQRDSVRFELEKPSTELDKFFEDDRYEQYKKDCAHAKPPKFAIGHEDINPEFTLAARIIFGVSCVFVYLYGFVYADEYPSRPIMMTLFLFPVFQIALRFYMRPAQKPAPNPVMEMEIAHGILKKYKNRPDHPHYVEARNHLEKILADKMIVETDKKTYYLAIGLSTLNVTLCLIVLYSFWVFDDPGENWDDETKQKLVNNGVNDEETAWIIWAGPAIIIMAYGMFSILFLLRSAIHDKYIISDEVLMRFEELLSTSGTEDGQKDTKEDLENAKTREILHAVKLSVCGVMAIILGFWLAAEAAGANPVVASTMKQFLLMFIVVFLGFLATSLRRFTQAIRSRFGENYLLKITVGALKSDWMKGFTMLVFPYWMPIYVCISGLNQYIRKCRGIDDMRDYTGVELLKSEFITKAASRIFKKMTYWNWTSIVGKTYVLGIVLFTLNVFAERCIYLLLIYVGEGFDGIEAENIGKAVLILILWYIVGIIGFMLPPVPGPPLYLFGGVVVVRAFDNCGGDGFWIGVFIVCIFSLILKLNACAIQQKIIGESLGSQAWVKAACGVQTPFIRAVELILTRPGPSMGKIAILCGGPDWPTSVLTGLLKCDLWEMLFGTCPMILLIVPTVLTGAFFLKEDAIYATIGGMLFVMSLLICAFMGLCATYAVQNELEAHPNFLRIKLKKNRELDWLDYRSCEIGNVYYEVNEWFKLPRYLRIYMVIGLLLMNFSMFVFAYFGDSCFGEFDLQTESKSFRDGSITLIKPLGTVTLIIFATSCIIFYTYKKILNARAAEKIEHKKEDLDDLLFREQWEIEIEKEVVEMEKRMKDDEPEYYEKYIQNLRDYEAKEAEEAQRIADAEALREENERQEEIRKEEQNFLKKMHSIQELNRPPSEKNISAVEISAAGATSAV
jgi:hypothetical protein